MNITHRQDTCFADLVAKTKKFNKAQVEFRLAKRVERWDSTTAIIIDIITDRIIMMIFSIHLLWSIIHKPWSSPTYIVYLSSTTTQLGKADEEQENQRSFHFRWRTGSYEWRNGKWNWWEWYVQTQHAFVNIYLYVNRHLLE